MNDITVSVEPCRETGGYVARWDAPGRGGITTQGDSFRELDSMISDAVDGYFEPDQRPKRVRLHFSEDPSKALPGSKETGFGELTHRDSVVKVAG